MEKDRKNKEKGKSLTERLKAALRLPQGPKDENARGSFLREFFTFREDSYEQSRLSPGRRLALLVFGLAGIIVLAVCIYGSFSVSTLSIRESSQIRLAKRSNSGYCIVYSAKDAFGEDAARSLQSRLFAKTGANLKIASDLEETAQHEIRIGYTKRAPDSYITSIGAIGKNGYAIIFNPGGSVDLVAFSKLGAEAAIMCFADGYGISYLAGNLNFASTSNLAYVSMDGSEPETSLYESKHKLFPGSDGVFRALVLSDLDINTNTVAAMEAILDEEKPELVILCGDVSSGLATKSELEEYLKVLTAPMESRRIPWCHLYGEQDGDGGLAVSLQNEVFASFPYCISKTDFESLGVGSYFIPVFEDGGAESGDAPIFGIWAMGQTGLISGSSVMSSADSVIYSLSTAGKDYGYVPQTHVNWLMESAEAMKKDREKGIPSVVVTHTPTDEFNVIAENPEKCGFTGIMGEAVSSSPMKSGLFSAILESKNIFGLYSGHDHLNNYSGRYLGIELGYVSSIGYDGRGYGGTFENNNAYRGGRIIEAAIVGGSVKVFSRMAFATSYGVTRE